MTRYNSESFEPCFDWYECIFDDAKAIAKLLGWHIDDIYFTGFWSQGDGACFTGTLGYKRGCAQAVKSYAPLDMELHDIAEAWQAAQRRNFYCISGSVKHTGRYSHEYSVSFDWEDSRAAYGWTNDSFDESAFEEPARDFMRWIYRQLEREYDYQRAWQMAQRWSDCADEAQDARSGARNALRDYRALMASKCAPTLPDSVKSAAKTAIRSALQEYADALELRAAIADDFHYWQDGKSMDVAEFAKGNL